MIRVAATQYTLGNRALELFLSGCKANPHCTNCHNPELWSYAIGEVYDEKYKTQLINKILDSPNLIQRIWIVGGEPLDQDHQELYTLCQDMKNTGTELWLFTRYDLDEVPEDFKFICDYIKCGRYLPDQCGIHEEYEVNLASDNQHIYKKGVDYAV